MGLPRTQVHGGSEGPPGPVGSVQPQTGLPTPGTPSATGSSATHTRSCISAAYSRGVFAEQPRQSNQLRPTALCGLRLSKCPI